MRYLIIMLFTVISINVGAQNNNGGFVNTPSPVLGFDNEPTDQYDQKYKPTEELLYVKYMGNWHIEKQIQNTYTEFGKIKTSKKIVNGQLVTKKVFGSELT